MTSYLLLTITLFNGVVMVPLYVTGDALPSDDFKQVEDMSKMNAATILNITATPWKMISAYFVALVVIPSFAYYMIYEFRKKYYSWKKRVNPMEEFRDVDIAFYAVEVRNLPIDEGVESL